MRAKTPDVMIELQPLLELAIRTFGARVPSSEEIADWISKEAAKGGIAATPVTQEISGAIREQESSAAVLSYQRVKHAPRIVGFDPVIGGVLIAGFTVLLNYLAGERRHKETAQGKPPAPPISPRPGLPQQDLCKRDFEGQPCGYPIIATKVVPGGNYIVRRCSRSPQPHLTVEKFAP